MQVPNFLITTYVLLTIYLTVADKNKIFEENIYLELDYVWVVRLASKFIKILSGKD